MRKSLFLLVHEWFYKIYKYLFLALVAVFADANKAAKLLAPIIRRILYASSWSQVVAKDPHRLPPGRSLCRAHLQRSSIRQGWQARPVGSLTPTSAWTVPLLRLQRSLTFHPVPLFTEAASGVTPSPNRHAQRTQIASWMHWASSWDRQWPLLMTSWPPRMTMKRYALRNIDLLQAIAFHKTFISWLQQIMVWLSSAYSQRWPC